MAKVSFLVFGILLVSFSEIMAQNSRDPNSSKTSTANTKTFKKSKKFSKKAYDQKYDQAIEDYKKLMKENKKKYAKMEKDMKKPQYSDPLYFGHKKPPKKRKTGKRKFCKECSIVH